MNKIPRWADILLTVWIIIVAVAFFGPFLWPPLGLWINQFSIFYVLMVVVSVVTFVLKLLRSGKN